jgi:hypothetical protein
MSIKNFRLDTKSAGAQALEGLWGPVVGDLLYDMSAKGRGRGNHCTRTGTGARSQMSDRGRVLLFNGADDVWTCERALGIGTASYTFMAWAWLDPAVAVTAACVMGSGDTGVGEFRLGTTNSHNATTRCSHQGDGGGISADGPAGAFHGRKGLWTHVAFTRHAGRATARTLVNGLQVGADLTAADNLNTAKLHTIGCADGHAARWWLGMIDDVRYYSRALSLGEIGHIYTATRWTPYADIAKRTRRPMGKRNRQKVATS